MALESTDEALGELFPACGTPVECGRCAPAEMEFEAPNLFFDGKDAVYYAMRRPRRLGRLIARTQQHHQNNCESNRHQSFCPDNARRHRHRRASPAWV